MAEVRVDGGALREFTKQVFVKAGMSPEDAGVEAEVLVWANLRGIDSHGVLRIPSYLHSVEIGGMNPKANVQIEKETAATMLIEADHAFGPVVTKFAMARTIEKAREAGVCWTEIRNTCHQGAMGYYALMAAEAGMAGIAIVCSPPNMAPFGAKAAGLHNSPIAIAVPTKSGRPLVLDMATSAAAGGKVSLAIDKGIPIPLGWALDGEGNPTTDPKLSRALLPFGGAKASGMAFMFECLTSLMVGNSLLESSLLGRGSVAPGTQNSVLVAVNVAQFTSLEEYGEHTDALVEGIKGLSKADGFDEILVPGEPEDRVFQERTRLGVPLPVGTAANLRAVSEKLGIPLPPGL